MSTILTQEQTKYERNHQLGKLWIILRDNKIAVPKQRLK